ncbi:cytokinesis protein sepH [Elsinoe australis]|uniref:non-specific serine/threonine protein kinase n=1 Tax=Elsinoe australis TaxID=40998 RepID=A0A4U7AXJ6_9PEZI|nr:cytokinesis protein sepH [Elsinoe australis]
MPTSTRPPATGKPDHVKRSNGTPDLSVNTKHTSRPSRHDLRDQVGRVSGHESKHSESGAKKEKPPSKDGAAQRAAGEVAGLKDYQLGDCLGKGAFGSVYRALNWGTGETVAVKQIKLADLPKGADTSLQMEIDLLKNLNHPNIVKYNGFVKSSESLYIILEYCENGSLHSICKNFGKFPENLVALYMSQVLHGLLYLHDQGVIHRDIKGANILTTKEGLVKLADFGVAAKKDGLHESSVVGTPYWMAPEVIELSGATTASDIWSLGCTVIELLDGKPPYHKLQPMPALFRIVNDDHPPLPEGASPVVRDFLMQCFQKDPNLRVSAKKLLKHPWIVSARRSDAVVKKPTKYDEAVKSVQEWNEALKSPNNSFRRAGRPAALSPTPQRKDPGLQTPAPTKGTLDLEKLGQRSNTKLFQSPEDQSNDNWDDDFATPITTSALKLPHMKPHDNFAGRFSSAKLKAYANHEINAEDNWDENFEGDLTVKSTMELAPGDTLQTVRAFFPRSAKASDIKEEISGPAGPSSQRRPSIDKRKSSRDSQPRTQILRPAQKKSLPKPKPPPPAPVRQPSLFRERSVEDYSDLIAADDMAFQRKLMALQEQKEESFSPRLFHPSDLHSMPRSATRPSGSMRRSSVQVQESAAMKRSDSQVEIQKYAENARDEDFSDIFGKEELSPKPAKSDHDSSSERGTLMMLNSKLSTNSWLGDEEDDDDPFAQLEESFDELDLETNIARDKHARLCTLVEGLVGSLKVTQGEDYLADVTDQLMQVLYESPDVKTVIVSSHGMLPILEILEASKRPDTVLRLLKIVNMLLLDNVEIQENLCFVGGIPIITRFAQKRYSSDIRLEAAAFVRQMFQTSTLTLQMFVSCGGLNVLVDFLEEDYEAERDLVLIGVNGIWSVFELQGPTPKNDFCRIFSRSNVLYPLSLVLNRVLEEEGELAELVEGRIVNIFLLFSQAENHVKETIADRMVLKRVLKDLRRMSPTHQITMLKFVKNLSMLASTLEPLQNSNAIEVLTDLLNASMKLPHFREISNQVLNIMYNLCRLSKERQEDAALNGVIPLLQRIVKTDRPLKEFALPILCDMAHSGKVCRKILWQNKGLQFYISLLADQYWQVTALDAIFIWLQEETARVEEHLLSVPSFSNAIIDCFLQSKADSFENLLEPLQKLLRLSPPVAASLADPSLFSRTVHKLQSKKALVRLNLLRIIRSICDASDEDGNLITSYGLYTAIADLAKHDQAILVREMAGDLIKSSELNARRSMDGVRRTLRRSSSSTMTPTLPSSSSLPPTPSSERGGQGRVGSYFDGSGDMRGMRPVVMGTSSPYRPVSRDGSGEMMGSGLSGLSGVTQQMAGLGMGSGGHGHGHSNSNSSLSGMVSQKSRLPRQRPLRHSERLSLAPVRGGENLGTVVDKEDAGTGRMSPVIRERTQVGRDGRRRRMTSQG